MRRTTKGEKLWSISIVDGGAKVFRNDAPLKSTQSGEEYGFLLDVSTDIHTTKQSDKPQSGKKDNPGKNHAQVYVSPPLFRLHFP